jgi:hypothetical protein
MSGNIDQIFFMLLSLKNNEDKFFSNFIIFLMILNTCIKNLPENLFKYDFSFDNDIKLIISSNEVPIVNLCSKNSQNKLIYSQSFLAIIHYLQINKNYKFDSLTEILESYGELKVWGSVTDNNYIFMPINTKKFLIDEVNQIYCHIRLKEHSSNNSDQKKSKKYVITLLKQKSNNNKETDINILKKFLDECVNIYKLSLKKLNDTDDLFIFEYKNAIKTENNKLELNYNKHLMNHNKCLLTNIFFDEKQKLINYITPFVNNHNNPNVNPYIEKYKRSGFTFKAGLLFYGAPGCGKTSTIKAILKYTNRHGIIINLNRVKTCEELELIFRSREINKLQLDGNQICFILEDCDAFEDNIIKTRNDKSEINKLEKEESLNDKLMQQFIKEATKTTDEDPINLSCFLNILDGIIELQGVMIILTTNYPEKIDEALIRPGRIDFKYEFKKATNKTLKEMLKFKFELSDDEMDKYDDKLKEIPDYKLSPAEVQSICFKNDNINDCINELVRIN